MVRRGGRWSTAQRSFRTNVTDARRVLLLSTTTGYQLRSFGESADRLGIELVLATDRCDHLDDPWWHSDGSHPRAIVVEPEPVLMARVAVFRAWLKRRPERAIAVVGHGTFLNRLTGHLFQNCELLSIEL